MVSVKKCYEKGDSHCPYLVSSETIAEGTGSAELAGRTAVMQWEQCWSNFDTRV